jgi:hypothetical protein
VKRSAVKVAAVPQIEGLTVEDFLKHARKKPSLLRYLPDEKDWHHLDKKWVCDVLYTHDTEDVAAMVAKAMQERRKKQEQAQDLLVEMRPEFAAALKRCQTFSCKSTSYITFP